MELGLKQRRALVLGASRGLGKAIAATLAREGATVVAASRNTGAIEAWIGELEPEARGRVTAKSVDLFKLDSVDALAAELIKDGGVDILVNNSGGPPPMTAMEAKVDAWTQQFQGMAANIFHLTGLLLPKMIERKWGRIVTILSSGVEQPIPRLAISNGIRSAVLGWSKTLSNEVAQHGITVNTVLPGRIETERLLELDQSNAAKENKALEQVRTASMSLIPAGRYGQPQEFADVVVFLASDRASFVNGAKIRIDGGQTKGI
jgi:3-oxoacyl-[acyl-carrier protein] reductase